MEEIRRCIEKAANFMDRVAGVCDDGGTVLYSTSEADIGKLDEAAAKVMESAEKISITDNTSYQRINDPLRSDYVCYVEGTDQISQTYLQFLTNWIKTATHDGSSESDKKSLIKNILLENELPGDIPLKVRECRIPYAAPRVVYNVRLEPDQGKTIINIMQQLYPQSQVDFILTMDEHNIVLVKTLTGDPKEEVQQHAEEMIQAFAEAGLDDIHIGIGMAVETLRDCARSYREASLSLTIGDISSPDAKLMYYNRLGLGRLIYQLPPTLCRMFLDEVFPEESYEQLDDETLLTIDKFFENNLNGSETSRQLFVHRNTLVYRLDKVQKITDLDLRNFDDAVLFKLASLVRKYLEKQDPSALTGVSRW